MATLDEGALAAGRTKGAIYRHFPSKGAFLLALFEQYAAVARAGSGARQAPWFIPLTMQFAAQATRDPLLRRRLATVLSEAPDGTTPESHLLKAIARIWPAGSSSSLIRARISTRRFTAMPTAAMSPAMRWMQWRTWLVSSYA